MAEGWPLPFGHTAVSVLRRITVTLSFLLPHFRRTHTHTHRLSPSLTGSPGTHTDTHIYTDSYADRAIFGLWQAATSPTLFFQFIVAQLGRGCQDNDVVLVPVPVSVSVLTAVVVAQLGKLVRQTVVGGRVEGGCAPEMWQKMCIYFLKFCCLC